MAENQVDGGQLQGTGGVANSIPSEPTGVQQPSFDAAKLQETLDTFGSTLETLTARVNGLQSVKDKDKEELKGLKRQIAEYENLKERFGADGAIEQIELKQALGEMRDQLSKLSQVSTPSPGTGASGAVNAAKAVEELQARGLDANDAGFIALLKEGVTETKLNAYIVNKTRPQPPANPGGVAQPPAVGAPRTTPEGLADEYKKKVRENMGNRTAITNLRKEYAEKGVPVWDIDFS